MLAARDEAELAIELAATCECCFVTGSIFSGFAPKSSHRRDRRLK